MTELELRLLFCYAEIMKYILGQPAILRFYWELDVVLTNILSLDPKADIVVLFAGQDNYIQTRYPTVSVHSYEDTRADKSYHPTVRPFLWHKYLTEDPSREQETYLQIDSDIIFRELPHCATWQKGVWYGSDCGGYLDYDYLRTRKNGEQIVDGFANIIGVPREVIEHTPGAGAQWVLANPTAAYWLKVYEDSLKLYKFLAPIDSEIQKWTAEMWAQLYNVPYFGNKIEISLELDFCRPTDDVRIWDQVKILHNAGVIPELSNVMFYKGQYTDRTPFVDNLDYVRRDKASVKYVEAIRSVVI